LPGLQRITATVGYRKEKRQVSMIIDIDGPSAVGKTTLITKLEKNQIGKGLPEVLETAKPPVKKPASAEQFLMKQLWFFEQSAKRYE
jgi:deoxyadenosine/deoxycytidine kinase